MASDNLLIVNNLTQLNRIEMIFIPVLKNETFSSIEMSQQCVTTWKRRNSEERLGVVQGGDVVVDGEGGVGLKYFWS